MFKVNDKVVRVKFNGISTIKRISKDGTRVQLACSFGWMWLDVNTLRLATEIEIKRNRSFTQKELDAFNTLEAMRLRANEVVNDKTKWSICPQCKTLVPFLSYYHDPTEDSATAQLFHGCKSCRESFTALCLATKE